MVTDEERYRFVTRQIEYHNEKIIESFHLYIKLTSALFGGVAWLRFQPQWAAIWPSVRPFATAMSLLVFGFLSVLILFDLLTWWGFRDAESLLTGGKVPPPKWPRSCRGELAMLAGMLVATVAAVVLITGLQ